jgi:small redox-active disulfide protein 2
MAEDEIRQVMIQGRLIGIVGLDDVIMKTAQTLQGSTDEEIQNSLLEAVSINNYIPATAREAYGRALLREFKIAQNLPVEQDSFNGLIIAVLGTGCARCSQLESDVRDLLSEMKITADLRHITDLKEIARYGVMGAPALVVNNKVVSAGEVPLKSKIRQWIIDACHQSVEADK